MSTPFDQAFSILIGEEGGYCNNSQGPGGATKYGICQRSYPTVDVKDLTVDTAKAIYKHDYWDKIVGDQLPPALALLVFDAAVNNGVSRSIQWLQSAVGAHPDGQIGPGTLALVRQHAGPDAVNELCAAFLAERMCFIAALNTWPTFGLGWSPRLAGLPYKSLQMSAAS